MPTLEEYTTIVMEMADVLSSHHLTTSEALSAGAMIFFATVDTDFKGYTENQKEAYCKSLIENYYAQRRETKSKLN